MKKANYKESIHSIHIIAMQLDIRTTFQNIARSEAESDIIEIEYRWSSCIAFIESQISLETIISITLWQS